MEEVFGMTLDEHSAEIEELFDHVMECAGVSEDEREDDDGDEGDEDDDDDET